MLLSAVTAVWMASYMFALYLNKCFVPVCYMMLTDYIQWNQGNVLNPRTPKCFRTPKNRQTYRYLQVTLTRFHTHNMCESVCVRTHYSIAPLPDSVLQRQHRRDPAARANEMEIAGILREFSRLFSYFPGLAPKFWSRNYQVPSCASDISEKKLYIELACTKVWREGAGGEVGGL